MPEIGRFRGIKIYVYFRDHSPPHVHAYYEGEWAVVAIRGGRLLAGSLPRHTLGLVRGWIRHHRAALGTAWDRAERGLDPGKIGGSR